MKNSLDPIMTLSDWGDWDQYLENYMLLDDRTSLEKLNITRNHILQLIYAITVGTIDVETIDNSYVVKNKPILDSLIKPHQAIGIAYDYDLTETSDLLSKLVRVSNLRKCHFVKVPDNTTRLFSNTEPVLWYSSCGTYQDWYGGFSIDLFLKDCLPSIYDLLPPSYKVERDPYSLLIDEPDVAAVLRAPRCNPDLTLDRSVKLEHWHGLLLDLLSKLNKKIKLYQDQYNKPLYSQGTLGLTFIKD
jgi:hypothetical protein